ncbi:hypothetical protein WMY93_003024 [Mugilogobius chulae]|uniref:Uncharacterized protein n=1 Tax=Mugilogobius chulae TaxID=88201 RepID=A0AAW0PVG2_9GOBI
MMGKSVWSEHVSGSESDTESTVVSPKSAELDYAEVQTKQADPSRAPVKKGTDTTYSEVRHSTQESECEVSRCPESKRTSCLLNHSRTVRTSASGPSQQHVHCVGSRRKQARIVLAISSECSGGADSVSTEDTLQASVEYAELNHDAEAPSGDGNHDDHTVQEEHKVEPCDTNHDTGAGE